MKTEARKMAEKMSKSKKEEDIAELAREISRGGKPKGISSDIPAGIREQLVMKEREAMFKKGEANKYAKGGAVKKKVKKYAEGGMTMPTPPEPAQPTQKQSLAALQAQAEMAKGAPQTLAAPMPAVGSPAMPKEYAKLERLAQRAQNSPRAQRFKNFAAQNQEALMRGDPAVMAKAQRLQESASQGAAMLRLRNYQQSLLPQQQGVPQQFTMQQQMDSQKRIEQEKQMGLQKLPQQPMMAKGGAVKKKKATGYAKGGLAMCGASVPPAQKGKK